MENKMAKLEISVDTEKQTVEVKVGKKKLDKVSDIWINTSDGGFFSVELSQREELDGMRKVTRLMASVNDEDWEETAGVDRKALSKMLRPRN